MVKGSSFHDQLFIAQGSASMHLEVQCFEMIMTWKVVCETLTYVMVLMWFAPQLSMCWKLGLFGEICEMIVL